MRIQKQPKPRQMGLKESRPELKPEDIQVGHSYRGKNPAKIGGQVNDRYVFQITATGLVQYDSSAVHVRQARGSMTYPKVTMEKFLKWASHEVF